MADELNVRCWGCYPDVYAGDPDLTITEDNGKITRTTVRTCPAGHVRKLTITLQEVNV